MPVEIVNHVLSVGTVSVIGVSSSSLLQIGDTCDMQLYSYFDTPPESIVIGPLAPLPSPEGLEAEDSEVSP